MKVPEVPLALDLPMPSAMQSATTKNTAMATLRDISLARPHDADSGATKFPTIMTGFRYSVTARPRKASHLRSSRAFW